MKNSLEANIDFSPVTKYAVMGLIIVLMIGVTTLIYFEASYLAVESVGRITCYSTFAIIGPSMLLGISKLFGPSRKINGHEELYVSIQQMVNERKQNRA